MKNNLLKLLISFIFLFTGKINAQVADTIFFHKYTANQKFIQAQVEGKNYNFLFDTGAGSTFISSELASALNLKLSSGSTNFTKEGTRRDFKSAEMLMLRIGKTYLMQKRILIADNLNSSVSGLPKLDGIISLKAFDGQIISIDFEKNILLIESNQSLSEKIKSMIPLDATFSNGINGSELNALLNVNIKGKLLLMNFDSGNQDRILLSRQSAKELNLAPDSLLQNNIAVNTGDVSFTFSSTVAENLTTVTKDLIYNGVLNYSFISGYTFTFDLLKQKVYLTPY